MSKYLSPDSSAEERGLNPARAREVVCLLSCLPPSPFRLLSLAMFMSVLGISLVSVFKVEQIRALKLRETELEVASLE